MFPDEEIQNKGSKEIQFLQTISISAIIEIQSYSVVSLVLYFDLIDIF